MGVKNKCLTLKQSSFCNKYIQTGNASEAYRQAYNAKTMKAETIHRKAAELIENGKVTARIDELQSRIREDHKITIDTQVAKYRELFDQAESEIADSSQKVNAKIRILARLDKISGLEVRKDEEPIKVFRTYLMYPSDEKV